MRSRSLGLTAALLSAALLLTGCGGGDEKKEPKADPTVESAVPDTWPLTGEELPEGKSAARNHPVLVAKIDNTSSASPQVGLGKADLVFEEMVEGRMTRLAAFFYSQLPKEVGPVRSMRGTDIDIVSPVDGILVTSGAAPITKDRLARAGVTFIEEGAEGFRRDPSRSQTYSVMADLKVLGKSKKVDEVRPDDYFVFGAPEDLPAGKPAKAFDVDFGNHTTSWSFANGSYVNETSLAGQGDEFPATNVLVIRVKASYAGYEDLANNRVYDSKFHGKGKAQLFHGGQVIDATWRKDGPNGALTLQAGGAELKVPVGRTWVELLPEEGSVALKR
ncbi:DUF3048 domain-containing protein [Nocardioides daphniae]|uniref:DUF3048 domain-containing protein n=1 Tax=Nocardioides daphniae TaxID=402297 RepID=A0ABQ1Q6J7_9ACTN|nr:DUF3048 domain-containing protein [Nocardioides daphniae]GGD15841.1 hypothetical protein GCM10007231_13600 [Nocardioides daphniae]